MQVAFVSDSHGSLDDFKIFMDQVKDADKIVHLGDVLYHGPRNPLPGGYNPKELAEIIKNDDRFVILKGNCDSEVDQTVTEKPINESEMLIGIDHNTFYFHHGHRFSEEEMVEKAKDYEANVVVYGHSHKKVLKNIDGILVVNPGSLTLPKDGSKSYGLYDNGVMKLYNLDGSLWIMEEEIPDEEENSSES